ncbi:poly(ADP-ribose) glycohydrolase-like [Panonychus citri]|uniref:poly(ADP-ribose) glycohydrolase-like n=1 Tax=Panonychus citri TaxID=50023 RepID=UPI00230775E2|nr:poly(ADP-ribose) glycohydrolase-like [Panonychus citri]
MINKEPDCCEPLGELKPGPDKTIFYQLPWTSDDNQPKKVKSDQSNPLLRPSSDYVQMPFDQKSQWNRIVDLLNSTLNGNGIKSFEQLGELLKSINPSLEKCSLNILNQVIDQMNFNEKTQFYDVTLPFILSSTLKLTDLIVKPIPLLKQKVNHSLFFNQQQLVSILANCFLGTFTKPTNSKLNHFTFQELFSGSSSVKRKAEKLKCILNYFHRVAINPPRGTVTFRRQYLAPERTPNWSRSAKCLKKLVVSPNGTIEHDGRGMLQVDFAHKLIGGKTLTYGMVQEEVRFVINPELIVSMLFTEKMLDNEAVVIIGTEQFNNYSGYSDTFKFAGDFNDSTPVDSWGRRYTRIMAMDALYFAVDKVQTQYSKKFIDRELVKSFTGFMETEEIQESNRCAVATGNWGCGVYRGDPQVKCLIQWIAASMALRDVVYFTFGDRRLANMKDTISQLEAKKLTTGQLYNYLIEYGQYIESLPPFNKQTRTGPTTISVFEFIGKKIQNN